MTMMTSRHRKGRRDFLKLAGAGMASLAAASLDGCGKGKSAVRNPSVVFILANGLGWGDPGCYSQESKIPTPNIDRAAREGMRFTDAHSPSSIPSPSRYGILTGRYAWRTGLREWGLNGYSPAWIEQGRMTVASLLKSQGYRTACTGVWNLGLGTDEKTDYSKPLHPSPVDYGFDQFFGIPGAPDQPPYLFIDGDSPTAQPSGTAGESPMPAGYAAGAEAPGYDHGAVLATITAKTIGFLEEQASQPDSGPFFLYCALPSPNRPWIPSAEFRGKSAVGPYGDMVMETDAAIGKIMDQIDRLDADGNILLVVTSVCGADSRDIDPASGHNPNGPFRGRQADIWEGGHRVPFVARWPHRIAPGTVSGELICLTDLLATCADMLGAPLPDNAGEDSFSILPVLLGESPGAPLRPNIVTASGIGMMAIREGDWKMISGQGGGGFDQPSGVVLEAAQGQLYNLAEDPDESDNLYDIRLATLYPMVHSLYAARSNGRTRPAGG